MTNRFRKLIAWTLLPQVLLVGGLGTGLHGLFGCEHGSVCTAGCCPVDSEQQVSSSCSDCVFCRQAAANLTKQTTPEPTNRHTVSAAGCDGCAVCDLLAQYHSVTPFVLESLAIDLALGEAAIRQQNAVIAASVRLAFSRGPPAV